MQTSSCNRSNVPHAGIMEHDSKAEFVRSIWSRLGVGDDGYLSLADLTKVCHAIGMENNAKELFTRLDLDGDGRISFGEFLHLFQKGASENTVPASPQASTSTDQEGRAIASSAAVQQQDLKRGKSSGGSSSASGGAVLERNSSLEDEVMLGSPGTVAPLLLPAEATPGNAGSVRHGAVRNLSVWRVLQHWERFGIRCGSRLLQGLGLPHSPNDQLQLQDLLAAVEDECCISDGDDRRSGNNHSKGASGDDFRRALCQLLLQETKHLRSSVEGAWGERDKLRADLAHTSLRLSSQAQELDDHTTALEATAHQHIQSVEKQHQEAARLLQERLSIERESRDQATQALADVTLRADHLQDQLNKTKARLVQADQTCERLDSEVGELTSKLEGSESSLADLQALNAKLQQQGSESGGRALGEDEEQWREVAAQLSRLRQENQTLKDTNDELLERLDQLTLHPTTLHNFYGGLGEVSLDGSCMGDYLLPANLNSTNSLGNSTANTSMTLYQQHQSLSKTVTPATNTSSSGNTQLQQQQQYQSPTDAHNNTFTTLHSSFEHQQSAGQPNIGTSYVRHLSMDQQPISMPYSSSNPPSSAGGASIRLKRSAGVGAVGVCGSDEEVSSSPRDVSAVRRGSPDLLSPRAGKIARCSVASPPPSSAANVTSAITTVTPSSSAEVVKSSSEGSSIGALLYYSCSQPTSLELQLSSLGGAWGTRLQGSDKGHHQRRVASTNSVVTGSGLSCCSSGSISPSVSAPQSARRGRGLGLEAELAGVRVEVAGLVQQRDHLASCVASQQIQLDSLLTQWSEWESFLKKIITELQSSELNNSETESHSPASASAVNTPDEVDNKELTDDKSNHSASQNLSSLPQTPSSDNLPLAPPQTVPTSQPSTSTSLMTSQRRTGSSDSLLFSGAKDDVLAARGEFAGIDNDAISEVSSNFQDSPRKPPADLLPLFLALQTALNELREKETLQRRDVQSELNTVEKEKAELQDRFKELDTEFQSVRGELERAEEYWLLKLQEEQEYYEEERRLYDDNFAKLEAKIREYESDEITRAASEANKQRLSPIDESVFFEQQVSALEEELSEARDLLLVAERARDTALEEASQAALAAQKKLKEVEQAARRKLEEVEQATQASVEEAEQAARKQLLGEELLMAQDNANLQDDMTGDGASEYKCPCSYSNGDLPSKQHHQVVQQLQESCKKLHAAQLSASTAREELESIQDKMEQRLLNLIKSQSSNGDKQKRWSAAQLVPAAAVTALLKGCREQQSVRVAGLEAELSAAHHHLHHHAAHHTQQVRRAARADKLLAELFVENAKLMRALHLTEARQKQAEQQLRMMGC